MGRFGWPIKYSQKDVYLPPPCRQEDNHAPPIPTQFFTLPVWRKNQGQQPSPSQHLSMSGAEDCQQSSECHRRTQTVDPREKALPPTPISSNEDVSGAHLRRVDSPPIEGQSPSNRPSRQTLQSVVTPATRPSPSRATAALAHASLAISLPHSMPRASASSFHSDVNSLAFIPIPQSDRHPFPTSTVRRTKSFHHLNECRTDDRGSLFSVKRSRRSRGISFGPVNTLDSDGKGKGKALEDIPSHITPPRKSLVRRASFWSRKRNDSMKSAVMPVPTLPPRNSFDHLSHMLPSLPPMSPLHFDTTISRSSHSSQTEEQLPPSPPGLSSRDEYQNHPPPPNPAVSNSEMPVRLPQPPGRKHRPATADSAVNRLRALSFCEPTPVPDTSALRSPPVLAPSERHDTAIPRQAARPRSQTNPPLLHRLSANLFSFGSSLSLSASRVTEAQVNPPEPSPHTFASESFSTKPQLNEESPAAYVERLLGAVSKAEIASILASRYG